MAGPGNALAVSPVTDLLDVPEAFPLILRIDLIASGKSTERDTGTGHILYRVLISGSLTFFPIMIRGFDPGLSGAA